MFVLPISPFFKFLLSVNGMRFPVLKTSEFELEYFFLCYCPAYIRYSSNTLLKIMVRDIYNPLMIIYQMPYVNERVSSDCFDS